MNQLVDILYKQWNNFSDHEIGFIRVDIDHPLEWHIGYECPGKKTLLLISPTEIGKIESSKSINVERRIRPNDNKWTMTFHLLKSAQYQVFTSLCADLILYSQGAKNSAEAFKKICQRYSQWSTLLEHQHTGTMDNLSKKGLIGELLFIKEQIGKGIDAEEVLSGWLGPEGGKQDFQYANYWYEIKSLGSNALSVIISSIEQLDSNGIGYLVIARIDQCSKNHKDSFTLNQLVAELEGILQYNRELSILFEMKLTKYGYLYLKEYDLDYYCNTGISYYEVNESFPKLKRTEIPCAIGTATYTLNLNMIKDYTRQEWNY